MLELMISSRWASQLGWIFSIDLVEKLQLCQVITKLKSNEGVSVLRTVCT